MNDRKFEILVKTEDGTLSAYCRTRQGALDFKAIERAKNPQAIITIREMPPCSA